MARASGYGNFYCVIALDASLSPSVWILICGYTSNPGHWLHTRARRHSPAQPTLPCPALPCPALPLYLSRTLGLTHLPGQVASHRFSAFRNKSEWMSPANQLTPFSCQALPSHGPLFNHRGCQRPINIAKLHFRLVYWPPSGSRDCSDLRSPFNCIVDVAPTSTTLERQAPLFLAVLACKYTFRHNCDGPSDPFHAS